MASKRTVPLAPLVALLALALGACSSGDDSSTDGDGGSTTTSSTAPADPLRVLVTNDDGFGAWGIDAVAQALAAVPGVEVTVVAPAENQSGTGSNTTAGKLTGKARATAGGMAATAVEGFPADSVVYALDTMGLEPDLVVSGINQGQNLGALTAISGTVGAAKQAADRGIPAVAASQGLGDDPDYDAGAAVVVRWVRAHAAALRRGDVTVGVVNLNFPTCTEGSARGVRQVPLAPTADDALEPADCESTATDVVDDIQAFRAGFVSVTQLTPAGETVTSSTTFPRAG